MAVHGAASSNVVGAEAAERRFLTDFAFPEAAESLWGNMLVGVKAVDEWFLDGIVGMEAAERGSSNHFDWPEAAGQPEAPHGNQLVVTPIRLASSGLNPIATVRANPFASKTSQ